MCCCVDVSLAGLQERFSNMAASLGLKFDVQHSKQSELCSFFLACDAFYVEVCCQDNGLVQTVKVAQANKQVGRSEWGIALLIVRSVISYVTGWGWRDTVWSNQFNQSVV